MARRLNSIILAALLASVAMLGPGAASTAESASTASGEKLVYVGILRNSASSILVYRQRAGALQQVGQITQGVSQPFGLFVDGSGNLYAANLMGGTVTVYAPGVSSPMRTLSGAGHPDAVAVGSDGTVYVNDCGYCLRPHHRSAVLEYANGSTTPTRIIYRFTQPVYNTGIALDSAGTLYVAYYMVDGAPSSPRGAVLAFARGSKHGRDLGIHVGSTGGIAIDRRNDLVLADQGSGSAFPAAVDIFPPGATSPSSQIAGYAYGIALNARSTELFTSGGFEAYAATFTYPKGGLLSETTIPGVAVGIAATT